MQRQARGRYHGLCKRGFLMYIVESICLRRILNSRGKDAVEAEICVSGAGDGRLAGAGNRVLYAGRASSSAAIIPGRRERKNTADIKAILDICSEDADRLKFRPYNQITWDEELETFQKDWGTDITLSLSLTFARAAARADGTDLVLYIRKCIKEFFADGCETEEEKRLLKTGFSVLVPIFSGGVHAPSLGGSMQQIMLAAKTESFPEILDEILECYSGMEKYLRQKDYLKEYSASSGFLVSGIDNEEKFSILADEILKRNAGNLSIAVDVAAEHLKKGNFYQFHNRKLEPDELGQLLEHYIREYPVSYMEDPFDADDRPQWELLYGHCSGKACLIADDMSATQTSFLDSGMYDGIVIKMKQAGSLSRTLETVAEAGKRDLLTCVSHRSYETEDTFMCDLGVAVHADYLKIGGPRRGDRTEKYNQLIRLSERYYSTW